jgi:branched-chain amino acid transport system permease protein
MSPTQAQGATRVASGGSPTGRRKGRSRISWGLFVGGAVVALFAVLPLLDVPVPVLLPGFLSSSGTLLVIAVSLVYAGVAISYDVLFGYTGLLSAGHALVFAAGVYGTNILMIRGWSYAAAAALAVVFATLLAAAIGAIALRVKAIAFTMVTLAFGEAFYLLLLTDPADIFGGDDGLPLAFDEVPQLLASARDVKWLYWLALAFVVVVYLLAKVATGSRCGRVWEAIRENEGRVELLGLIPYGYKLIAFVFSNFLAAIGGAVYLLVVRGANPSIASVQFSLALIVMVVLGGSGKLWGAALGGFLYGLLTLRLPALSSSGAFDGLPDWAARVLTEPLFILGVLFIFVVLFLPTGISGLVSRGLARRRRPHFGGQEETLPGAPVDESPSAGAR